MNSSIESTHDIYEVYFEIPFLRDAEEFYHQQPTLSLESNSLLEYLTQVSFSR